MSRTSSRKHGTGLFVVRARFVFAYETSLRPETLSSLRAPDDYSVGRKTLRIRDEVDKARFGRELPLTKVARQILDRICPQVGFIFGRHDYRAYLKRAALDAKLPPEKAARISPYDFRHACLTHLAEESPNLPGMAFMAGHKHLTTTAIYLRPNQKAAENVIAASDEKGNSGWYRDGEVRQEDDDE